MGVIDNWKKGGVPRVDAVVKLAGYLGVSTDYLLGLTDEPSPAADRCTELTQEEMQLIDRLRRADAHTRNDVLKMAMAVLPPSENMSE